MFGIRDRPLLDAEINRALLYLNRCEFGSEDYAKTMLLIQDLYGMKEEEKSHPVSKDVLATVLANLLGIFMIIKHEHVNVITSRAMSLLLKPITRI